MKIDNVIEKSVLWIRDHQEKFWAITGTLVLSVLFVALVIYHRQAENAKAWSELGTIQGQLMQEKYPDVSKSLTSWEERYKGTSAATYAKFMKADLLFRTSDYVQAAQLYGEIATTGTPDVVRPLALSAQTSSEELAGHLPKALELTKTFMDLYPDHFLSAPRFLQHARLLEATGDKAGAAAVYNKFVLLYPQSPWTELARTRATSLSPSTPATSPTPIPLTH